MALLGQRVRTFHKFLEVLRDSAKPFWPGETEELVCGSVPTGACLGLVPVQGSGCGSPGTLWGGAGHPCCWGGGWKVLLPVGAGRRVQDQGLSHFAVVDKLRAAGELRARLLPVVQ